MASRLYVYINFVGLDLDKQFAFDALSKVNTEVGDTFQRKHYYLDGKLVIPGN